MEPTPITMTDQLRQVAQQTAECQSLSAQLKQLQTQLQQLTEQYQDDLHSVRHNHQLALENQLRQIKAQAQARLDAAQSDYRQQTELDRNQAQRDQKELQLQFEAERTQLEERRNSETWILQSILDEATEDSPITTFERETDSFVAHKDTLDQQLEDLNLQVQQASEYLERCHAAVDATLPEANLTVRDREGVRNAAVEEANALVAQATQLSQVGMASWVQGARIWGLSLLSFLVLWIGIAAVRADLRDFVNPELTKPDWEWVGVAAVIAAVVVVMVSLLLLMRVQGQLRHRFQEMLQHFSNVQLARKIWEQKSVQHLERLDRTAKRWRQELEERRRQQTLKIQTEIDARLTSLQQHAEAQRTQIQTQLLAAAEQQRSTLTTTLTQIETERDQKLTACQTQAADDLQTAEQRTEQRFQDAIHENQQAAQTVLQQWKHSSQLLVAQSQAAQSAAAETLVWPEGIDWKLPTEMPRCLSVAEVRWTAPEPVTSITDVEPASAAFAMPAVVRFPTDTSILVEHDSAGREVALQFIRRQLLKLITIIPAGRFRLTLIDPIGLGQSFSAMMHLADFDELLIHSRIWTDSNQIRDQLQKVTEHMENIFQTYLRSQFNSIEEYNASAGEVAEPYHFVAVAGFPTAFTEEAGRHLSSILTSGARCGVHAVVAWNPSLGVPPGFDAQDLTNHCLRFQVAHGQIQPATRLPSAFSFQAFPEPPAEDYVRLVREVGAQSRDARRVEVSFTRIAPRTDEIWTHSTADGLDLPIGRAGAARLQYMRLGRGTSQHVLIAGKTGSGKSTFLHILITNLALHYSPDEIQFYLIDFKKGVEFRTYAAHKLPHARVVAIESDREFGLSVLERLDEILQERGELFREKGVQDVPSFRERFPTETMPRLLLLIDEFQEFFTAEDRVSARASLLLDRLVRQGRAFGIHILLGSQTLGGAYSLARSTMGQIAVRIALQCSESDAHLILSEDNMAARLLTRPGEAIYNDANGMVQGNHQFQVAWLDEAQREQAIATMLQQPETETERGRSMVVFEGNVPPTVEQCGPLNAWLSSPHDATRKSTDALSIWLGEPVAIAAPTRVELRRATGQNLLIVGQDEAQVDSLLACTSLSVCWPQPTDAADAVPRHMWLLHDGRDPEAVQRFQALQRILPTDSLRLHEANGCSAIIESLHAELIAREGSAQLARSAECLLVVRNIGQFRDLRKEEDDFGLGGFGEPKAATTASMFADLLKRGPLVGIHAVVWADTYNNAIRWLSNSLLREFESRVAFRMNQSDSSSLVDNPVAASLDQGRALIYRDQTGTTEKFRPFAWPSTTWLESLRASTSPAPETTTPQVTDVQISRPATSDDEPEMRVEPQTPDANDSQTPTSPKSTRQLKPLKPSTAQSPSVPDPPEPRTAAKREPKPETVKPQPPATPAESDEDPELEPLDEQPFDINSLRIE